MSQAEDITPKPRFLADLQAKYAPEEITLYQRLMAARNGDKSVLPNLSAARQLADEALTALWKQQQEIDRLRAALSVVREVCGRNNCNCPGAERAKRVVEGSE